MAVNRADIGGDVLALEAVAAGRGLDEFAIHIAKATGKAVDLGLGRHRQRRVDAKPQKAPHAFAELHGLLVREGVRKGEHRHGVTDFRELFRWRSANPLVGGVLARKLRMLGLKLGVTAAEGVIVRVRKRRRIVGVVAPVGPGYLGPEPFVLFPRLGEACFGGLPCHGAKVADFRLGRNPGADAILPLGRSRGPARPGLRIAQRTGAPKRRRVGEKGERLAGGERTGRNRHILRRPLRRAGPDRAKIAEPTTRPAATL